MQYDAFAFFISFAIMPSSNDHHREPADELLGGFAVGKARWILIFLFGLFALFFLLTWLIRYPDIFTIRVMVRATDRVERYTAAFAGQIAEIPVENGQEVDSGAVLLVWKHGGAWRDILALGTSPVPAADPGIQQIDALNLGELESQWAIARSAWADYRTELLTARSDRLSPGTLRQIKLLDSVELTLFRRRATLDEQVNLAEADWQRYQRLAEQNTASREALDEAERKYLETRETREAIESELYRVALQREALEKEQLDLALQDSKVLRQKMESWDREWRTLQALRQDWIERYLVRSRQAGRVVFSRPLEPLQWLEEGEPTLALALDHSPLAWQARGWLPARGAGRVETGAEVQLRLDAFPYEEYGCLDGKLVSVSPLSENESFLVEIALPDSLITDTGQTLPVKAEMPATARIFSSKKRLLQRMLEGFRKLK
ncbi:MAG: HlyD family efflux transporter periplasmic adaptor subunit [Lewinellaceae bacterium]|nr:HlyD family efflux transporter periplasmic adaptor subunit [Lewinellaceae bacterium]